MTYSSQIASGDAPVLVAGQARPLPAGAGLAIGAVVSLALWGGIAQVLIRLVG